MTEADNVSGELQARRDPYLLGSLAVLVILRLIAMTRAPDIDELFTSWIAERSLPEMMQTLRLDSGPPLFYLILTPFRSLSLVVAARVIALLAGIALYVLAVISVRDIWSRRLVAALIALHPLHLFFSTRGRAYSLVALIVLVAAIALTEWADTRDRRMLLAGAICLLVGAYTHYYAIYLFPLPFLIGLTADRRAAGEGLMASAAVTVGFVPGLMLLRLQPTSALAWMQIEEDLPRVLHTLGSFARLGFDGRQRVPVEWVTTVLHLAGPLLLVVALTGARRSSRASRYLLAVVTAIAGAVAAAALGFNAYFPLRFESILIGPVVLFFVLSIRELRPELFRALAAIAILVAAVGASAIAFDRSESWTPERYVARAIRENVPERYPIFTSGPVFFELRAFVDEEWSPPIRVFPSDRDVHPGHLGTDSMIASDMERLSSLDQQFIWVGPTSSAEKRVLRSQLRTMVLGEQHGLTTLLVDPSQPDAPEPND